MYNENPTKRVIATKICSNNITTIKYQTGYGYSHETGIRNYESDGFNLVQHEWSNLRLAHVIVCLCVAKGWDSWRILKVMDFIKDKNFFRKKGII